MLYLIQKEARWIHSIHVEEITIFIILSFTLLIQTSSCRSDQND